MTIDFRTIDDSELARFLELMGDNFGEDVHDGDLDAFRRTVECDRILAGFDGEEMVTTSQIYSRSLSIPGAQVPLAAVSDVSVSPTHRRRGALTEMMRRMLAGVGESGREAVAALWASESAIYGRFGYGLAARNASLSGASNELRFLPEVRPALGRVRLYPGDSSRKTVSEIYQRAWPGNVGFLDRTDPWWDVQFHDPEHYRRGATARKTAVFHDESGVPRAYARYRLKEEWNANTSEVQVSELIALDPGSYAAIWRFLLDIDLHPRISRRLGPVDDPIQHMVVNPREAALRARDGLWVRLVDVPRALAARTYGSDVDVVFEVTDDFLPHNAGRFRLAGSAIGATCDRTTEPADIALSAADLGAVYLGGTTLATLAAAGRVGELRPGTVRATSRAFASDVQPWCPEVF